MVPLLRAKHFPLPPSGRGIVAGERPTFSRDRMERDTGHPGGVAESVRHPKPPEVKNCIFFAICNHTEKDDSL